MTSIRPIRVILGKIGFDGHDRGAKVVVGSLRDAGMEVIYTGPYQTIEAIVATAIQEDADVIGISSLTYDHVLLPQLIQLLREKGGEDIIVIAGGIIPKEDANLLEKAGVAKVFHPSARLDSITDFIRNAVGAKKR